MRRDRALLGIERWWQRDRGRIVHIPVATGRRKGMVRVGKRTLNVEGLRPVGARVVFQKLDRSLGDIGSRIEFLRDTRAPSLWCDIIISRQLIFWPAQSFGIGMAFF